MVATLMRKNMTARKLLVIYFSISCKNNIFIYILFSFLLKLSKVIWKSHKYHNYPQSLLSSYRKFSFSAVLLKPMKDMFLLTWAEVYKNCKMLHAKFKFLWSVVRRTDRTFWFSKLVDVIFEQKFCICQHRF